MSVRSGHGIGCALGFLLGVALHPAGIAAETAGERVPEAAFTPPLEHRNARADLRSPFLFEDGSRVTMPSQWTRRRAEIRATWMRFLGPWPELLPRPRLETISESRRDGILWRRVKVPMSADVSGEGWLLVPEGRMPRPAALVVYYEPETSVGLNPKQTLRDFGLQLARRGFVTLSIGTPGGDARRPQLGSAVCQPLSFHAYVAANCWGALAALPEVDRERIAVVGHSYGGKWAMFAAALWDRFAAVVVSDPGVLFDESRPNVNYWEPWYLGWEAGATRAPGVPTESNPRTGAYRQLVAAGHDLHEIHALIAPRPFLVSGGAEDPVSRWSGLVWLAEINRLLGHSRRVALTSRPGHDPSEASNAQVYAFLEEALVPERRAGPAAP